MAEILIFPKQTVVLDQYSDLGFYTALIDPAPITFTVGESYRVIWNDTEWYCVALDAGAILEGAVFVGDASLMGLPGNGEPFVIGGTAESPMNIISLNDSEPSTHSVAIYKVTDEEPEQEGIVLKDRKGNDVAYYGIETVTFDTTEGKQQVFTKGEAVEGLEIVPDFSDGDMAVNAPAGMLVKSAVVKQPAGLTPGNIRNGAEVAGVTGDFIGDTEEVIVELNMADGDQEITPSAPGKVLSHVVVKRPDTLLPENIAEDVEIGGVVGTLKGGGVLLYPFIALTTVLKRSYRSSYGYVSPGTSTITLPAGSIILSSVTTGLSSQASKATTESSNLTLQTAASYLSLSGCVTEGEDETSITMNAATAQVYQYYAIARAFVVTYSIPGIYAKQNDDDTVTVYADETVSTWPTDYPSFAGITSVVDLSSCKITTLSGARFSKIAAHTVIFPATLTSIASNALYNSTIKTIDASHCTAVPTVGNSLVLPTAVEQILVPAALYDEWIAAEYWSALSDKIVAV